MTVAAYMPPSERDQHSWLDALLAFVQALLAELFDDMILPLAYGPRPSRRRLAQMAEQFARAETSLIRVIHNTVRLHAGLEPQAEEAICFPSAPRTGPEFARRLKIYYLMLNNPQKYIGRILYRMYRDHRRCLCAAAMFDPLPLHPARRQRVAASRGPQLARALELSGWSPLQ